jgi:hypothetical protein
MPPRFRTDSNLHITSNRSNCRFLHLISITPLYLVLITFLTDNQTMSGRSALSLHMTESWISARN